MRLLRERGFDMLDEGCAEAVLEAVEALDTKTRREDGTILALRGVAHAAKGRPARGEALLRRALAHAGGDRPIFATIALRLALLLANRGDDVRELLSPIAGDPERPAEIRAEALSLIAAQRALANDGVTASAAVEQVRKLLPSVDHDIARAKVLQRIGVAAVNTGDIAGAQCALEEAADLAMELELFSLASRAYANLCNLVLHEYDDVQAHANHASRSVIAADRSGNPFDRQTALIQVLRSEMREGNVEASLRVERELASIDTGDGGRGYVVPAFEAIRLTWGGGFSEARQLLVRSHRQFHYLFDRAVAGSLCALLFAMDGKRDSSSALVTEIVRDIQAEPAAGLFGRRRVAVALMYCSIAEAINRRVLQAGRILRQLENDSNDAIMTIVAGVAGKVTTSVHQRFPSDEALCATDLATLSEAGYVDVALTLSAVLRALHAKREDCADLSPAEVAILQMLSDGLSTKEIALRTSRSIFTVRAHIANAIAKLNCHGKLEAIAIARRRGIVA
jgi:DNA-binding CsgD family transcriptional regulator